MNLDFYLRVSLVELRRMRFEHLETALDIGSEPLSDASEMQAPAGFGGIGGTSGIGSISGLCGYTEWATLDEPSASLGWDWVMPLTAAEVILRRHSIRTNLRVIGMEGASLGLNYSLEKLLGVIDTLPWKEKVVASLCCSDHRPWAPGRAYL